MDGHQRRLVWSVLPTVGPDHEVDVRVSSRALTEQERQQLVVYLHRGTLAEWDWDKLATFEVPDLLDWGFSEDELQLNWGSDEPTPDPGAQVDKAAELQEKWQVERGQVWEIPSLSVPGKAHRVMCGDSTDEGDVGRLMGEAVASFTFTDPPYNVGVAYGDATDDNRSKQEFTAWCKDWIQFLPSTVLLTTGVKRLCWWDTIFDEPQWIIAWVKKNGQGQTGLLGTNKWDPILVYGAKADNGIDLIEINNDYGEGIKAQGLHPTAKPVGLWAEMITRFSDDAALVFEPFLASGTTLAACEQTGRIGFGMEIEPKYVSVSLERLAGMSLEPRLVEQ